MGDLTRREFVGGVVAGALAGAVAGGVSPECMAMETAAAAGTALNDQMAGDDAWAAFLGALDLMWTTMPINWYDAPFLGNGNLGTLLYQPSGTALQFLVGHSWVQDHRLQFGSIWGEARLPVGHLHLQ